MVRRIAAPPTGVPFLHEKQIEAEADLLLAEFADKVAPVTTPAVPIEQIAEVHLQLELEFKNMRELFPEADVHGAIWFTTGRIGIDQALEPMANPSRVGRYHFTLAHEIGHWRLHRQHFLKNPSEQRRLFDDGSPTPDVVCRSHERKKPVEWQADCFAACLLMPRKMVYAAWTEFRSGDDRPVAIKELHASRQGLPVMYRGTLATTDEELDNAVKEEFCRPLAVKFQVSAEAMRIRLESLKLLVPKQAPTLF
jgi:Zn-dependent peptidase ImmA (M78 family)